MKMFCVGKYRVILLLVFFACSVCNFLSSAEAAWNGDLASSFAGGDGLSVVTAYEIATPEQLAYMADLVSNENAAYGDKFYRLTADIDLGGMEWMPIGMEGASFAGYFDGNAHTIRNLRIDRADESTLGLFGSANAATFKDVFIEGVDIVGAGWIGGLAGYLGPGGRALGCSASGRIAGTGDCVGGLVGENQGELTDSYAACRVEGGYNVGGFVGANVGTIADCHAEGYVTATGDYVGGFAGLVYGDIGHMWALGDVCGVNYVGGLVGCVDRGSVVHSFATGNVAGRENVGGAIGLHNGAAMNVYAYGDAAGSGDYVGGLIGYNTGGVVENSFAVGHASGMECVGGLIGGNGGRVEKAYVGGSAVGTNYVGGAVGSNWGDVARVGFDGSVRGKDCVGGLIGRHALATLDKSETRGYVEGESRTGALVGHFYSGSVGDCRWSSVARLEAFGEEEEGTVLWNTGSYAELGRID